MRISVVQQGNVDALVIWMADRLFRLSSEWALANGLPHSAEALVALGRDGVRALAEWQPRLPQLPDAGDWVEPSDVVFLPPVPRGRKIVCVGLNYRKHVEETHLDAPSAPLLFSKFDNALTGHDAVVARPRQTTQLDYEAEIAVVMGRKARDVPESDALDYVLGLTLANDLSARDVQFASSQWLLGKTYDGFCPIGPALVTLDECPDVHNIGLRCSVNGELRQNASTAQMIFSFETLIHYVSSQFTLEPGDVILTGTPDGVVLGQPEEERHWLQPGDEVVVEAEGLGRLRTVIE
ncbi:hypothetical protein GCM10025857_24150 [Alicyclobacillus contaminans]|uniref:fumarylacetoacetate hydrolase family protein n=1 Tax=Alicyclobacillus contaminans TaxID=392016 RepID=UPI0004268F14|nr:fumarylacetoacetate hydrolase family protein [Alicyclobacillus contaminans]GMA51058.1 hypothetical protein GCM10025857_24150 [Alicyclobacillus contaminans]